MANQWNMFASQSFQHIPFNSNVEQLDNFSIETMSASISSSSLSVTSTATSGGNEYDDLSINNENIYDHLAKFGIIFSELNDTDRLSNITSMYNKRYRSNSMRNILVCIAYAIIFFISLFGNITVCYIIATNRKMHNFTNYFIANLSVSDLLMTVINVPFGVARMLLDDWPFGNFLCKCLPFIQATSVYVSTITMCIISIDRYCVVVHPFGSRVTNWLPLALVLTLIWTISLILSIPFAYFNEVVKIDIIVTIIRCRSNYPSPNYSKWLTLFSFLTQYLIPLTFASIAYLRIAFSIKHRSKLGAKTPQQMDRILKTNRKTIIMLVLVLIAFAICWLPLHLFHLYLDFINSELMNTQLFIVVHWLGMSSVMYNSFIYSSRNKHFRCGMKKVISYLTFNRLYPDVRTLNTKNGSIRDQSFSVTQMTTVRNSNGNCGLYQNRFNRKLNRTNSFGFPSIDSNDRPNSGRNCIHSSSSLSSSFDGDNSIHKSNSSQMGKAKNNGTNDKQDSLSNDINGNQTQIFDSHEINSISSYEIKNHNLNGSFDLNNETRV
ncbi:Neuropeptide Y receptor [Blomia tropicalis]|nr:Neuropeptide Y receptor [Blomia tropicalis]